MAARVIARHAGLRVAGRAGLLEKAAYTVSRPFSTPTADLKDEYGEMDGDGETFVADAFRLESGEVIRNAVVRYKTWGELSPSGDNAVVVPHALTGNAALDSWWGGMLGPGRPLDTNKYFVFCANVLGSCYGSTGPTEVNPETGERWGADFPTVTVRDTVRIHREALEATGCTGVAAAIGGSLGGMQAMEWLAHAAADGFVRSGIAVGCGTHHHAWQIGISECQRAAIAADPKFNGGRYSPDDPPKAGLAVARMMAMVTYRTHAAYTAKFNRDRGHEERFAVEDYLEYQGKKFCERFDANSFMSLTRTMDSHDLGRGRGGIAEACSRIHQPVLTVGIDSDVLYPPAEQEEMARLLPNAEFRVIRSNEGHDGFLVEDEALHPLFADFLVKNAGC